MISTLVRRTLNALLPVECAVCRTSLTDDPVPFFCRRCWSAIEPFHGPSCPRCHQPFPSVVSLRHSPTHLCGACRKTKPAYTEAWSLYPYVPPLQEAIRLFKYGGKVTLVDALAELLIRALPETPAFDFVMPVPLHPTRLREREFNQSLLLAERLSRRLRIPLSFTNLVRVRATEAQTRLRRSARLKNLRRAFQVQQPQEVAGKRVLLIDDVWTTGTTINECAKALRKVGAGDVFALTLARAVSADLLSARVEADLPSPALSPN
ncbi:MAG: amidophosphoribosyltransferase [Nitrospiraceae bacterium]|nr:MAG: amidophosphoribosyltransferase [Nitrospiraceae bacterium]